MGNATVMKEPRFEVVAVEQVNRYEGEAVPLQTSWNENIYRVRLTLFEKMFLKTSSKLTSSGCAAVEMYLGIIEMC